jgi:hypothetical protein
LLLPNPLQLAGAGVELATAESQELRNEDLLSEDCGYPQSDFRVLLAAIAMLVAV